MRIWAWASSWGHLFGEPKDSRGNAEDSWCSPEASSASVLDTMTAAVETVGWSRLPMLDLSARTSHV